MLFFTFYGIRKNRTPSQLGRRQVSLLSLAQTAPKASMIFSIQMWQLL